MDKVMYCWVMSCVGELCFACGELLCFGCVLQIIVFVLRGDELCVGIKRCFVRRVEKRDVKVWGECRMRGVGGRRLLL